MLRKLAIAGGVTGVGIVATASPAFAADELTAPMVQANLDNVFVLLIARVLVIFMQAGFALVEAGLTRAKSVGNIMMKNLMDFCAGVIAFFCGRLRVRVRLRERLHRNRRVLPRESRELQRVRRTQGSLTVPVFFVFQVAFAATAATIVSGAMAERTKFKRYLIYSIVISAFIYPVVVHWMWGGGWLAQLDTPFHRLRRLDDRAQVGGVGRAHGRDRPRAPLGKYGPDGKPRAIPGHSIPFAVLGTFILLVGWYGFNPGSELAADGAIGRHRRDDDPLGRRRRDHGDGHESGSEAGKPDVSMAANGILAGLVGITAGCAAVSTVGGPRHRCARRRDRRVRQRLASSTASDRRPGRCDLGARRRAAPSARCASDCSPRNGGLEAGPVLRRRRRPARHAGSSASSPSSSSCRDRGVDPLRRHQAPPSACG